MTGWQIVGCVIVAAFVLGFFWLIYDTDGWHGVGVFLVCWVVACAVAASIGLALGEIP